MTRVTLLIRTKDRPGMLRRALDSIANQQCSIVVAVDPRANQHVYDVLNEFGTVNIVKCTRPGLGAAWNEGMATIPIGFVKIFDDDDVFLHDGICVIKDFIRNEPNVGECLTTFGDIFSTSNDSMFGMIPPNFVPPGNFNKLPYRSRILLLLRSRTYHGGYMFTVDTYQRLGPVREDLPIFEDYEWGLRSKGRLLHCAKPVLTHYSNDGNVSKQIQHKIHESAVLRTKIELSHITRWWLVWASLQPPRTKKIALYGLYRLLLTPYTEQGLKVTTRIMNEVLLRCRKLGGSQ